MLRARVLPWLAGLAVMLPFASSCASGPADWAARLVFSERVVAARGGTVELGGVRLDIPPGALSADTTVTASRLKPPTPPPGAVRAAGDAVRIEIGTAHLLKPIDLSLPLHNKPASPDAAGLAYFDSTTNLWTPVPARVDTASGTITTTVAHLTWWQPWTWDLSGLETTIATLLKPVASFRADPPTCGPAPGGVKLTINGGRAGDPALDGCVEAAGDKLRVKFVNNRSYATVVGAPGQARPETGSRGGLYDAMLQSVDPAKLGGYYLPAGGAVSYLTERTGGDVYFNSGPNLLAFMITTAADFALALVKSKAADSAVAAGKAPVSATKLDAGLLTKIGKCLGDTVASQPPASVPEALRLTLGCLELLATGVLHGMILAPLALLQTLIVPLAAAYDIGQDSAAGGSDSTAVLVRGNASDGYIDLHSINWAEAVIPGELCRSPKPIQLHGGEANNVPSTFAGPTPNYPQWVSAHVDKIRYGDLTGDARDEAFLPVLCANQDATAAGQNAYGVMVFDGLGKRPHLIGTLVGQQPTQGEPPNLIVVQQITRGQVVAEESFYGSSDANCCPTGRARDVWRFADARLTISSSTVTVRPG